ncbi:MAG: family 1 glycosylhydrolase [Nakamurella sp.]
MGFLVGTAASAYPTEGGSDLGGRGPSLWDAYSALPGRIADGSDGRTAIDHFHHWSADLDLLADLGVQAYRFSLSWSRVQPRGSGPANNAGIDFYDRVIDRLLAAGIAPFVGLQHADMPIEVMERGGWLTRDTAHAFADYAAIAADAFGDRVAGWTTVDEPLVQMAYGYAIGIDAPGLTLLGGAFQVSHHQLLGHGLAARILRDGATGAVGIVNQHTAVAASSRRGADLAAARFYDDYHNRQFADPVLLGRYPSAILSMPGAVTEVIFDDDLDIISAPLDFYAVNYAHPTTIAAAPDNSSVPFSLEVADGVDLTAAGWPVSPPSLTRLLIELSARYPALPPVYVTGVGGAFTDMSAVADSADPIDADRIAFLDAHLAAVDAANAAGCDVRGYFHYGLLDSWEWTEGFTRKYGLVRVDPETLERSPRPSYGHFRELIRARAQPD